MFVLITAITFTYLFMFGRSLTIIYNFFNVKKILIDSHTLFGIRIFHFYTLISLFFIGNLGVAINFFIPIDEKILIYTIPLLLFNFQRKLNIKFTLFKLFNFLLIFAVALFSIKGSGFHHDSGLYHLNYQNILRTNKIQFGLVNLYDHYGFSSVYEYIGSIFWIGENLILLQIIPLIFVVFFFSILLNYSMYSTNQFIKYGAFLTLCFMILDNFGVDGGNNGTIYVESVGKFDLIFGILFATSTIFLLYAINTKEVSPIEEKTLFLLILFSLQIRLFGFVLLYLLTVYYFSKKSNFKNILKNNGLGIILLSVWIIKNVINSGCLFFPVQQTCINILTWSDVPSAGALSSFLRNYFLSEKYEILNNQRVLSNYLISLILILLVIKFFLRNKLKFEKINILTSIFLFINLSLFYFTPSVRFFTGFFTVTPFILLCVFYKNKQYELKTNLIYPIFIFALIFFPRIYQYNFSNLNYSLLSIPQVEYKQYENSKYVTPLTGDQCWVNIDCTPIFPKVNESYLSLDYKIYLKQ